MSGDLLIGAIAARAGTNVETVRYYEKQGLMPAPPRTGGGHRIYDRQHLKRLNFIRRCRELGFTLDRIRELLSFVDGGDYSCADVKTLTLAHLREVRRKVVDLRRIEGVLREMADRCEGGEVPECPIVDALFDGED